jgi:N utilization substance protein A
MALGLYGGTEILQIADAVAREKGIDRDAVLEAMEQAIQIAGRRKYGHEHNIKAEIERKTGEIRLYRLLEVVEKVESDLTQISVERARKYDGEVEVGGFVRDKLPPIDFGRIAAQTAKQVIVQKVRDAERDKQFQEYSKKIGEIINGVVKRVEFNNVVVDLGRTEAVLRREDLIPREVFRQGDRIRAYIADVRREKTGAQIFLSRTHPQFMAKLFTQEVPEIYDGIIVIKAVARDPGSRAKMAVISHDSSIDPIGSCVGVRGSRVQAVVQELQGEKVDIIHWSADPATFIVNALAPAEVSKVVIDQNKHRIEAVVPEEQLSLAIGRRGQNVRLATQLTGWEIDILTDEEESSRRAEEVRTLSQLFVDGLNVDEMIAHLLVTEGFSSIEEVAYTPVVELATIEGFDEAIAAELNNRAHTYITEQQNRLEKEIEESGMEPELLQMPHLNAQSALKLAQKGIRTLDDLGELSTDEFLEMFPELGLDRDAVNETIMAARAHWFGEAQTSSGAA